MKIEKNNFGTLKGGEAVTQYKLITSDGMEVQVLDYGLTITSILLPTNNAKDNIVCGFDTLDSYFSDEYIGNAPYFGAAIGRYCSTIKDACYGDVALSANSGGDCLHGGAVGFDKRIWTLKRTDAASLTFSLTSGDGDQGFPGKVDVEVTISLSDDHKLSLSYRAVSDKETPFSMTNHSYFNLSGFRENVENHFVKLNSVSKIPLNSVGTFKDALIDVKGKADDLSAEFNNENNRGKRVGEVHQAMGDGFEHFYLFDEMKCANLRHIATFSYKNEELNINRSVDVSSTEIGTLLYTGKYTSEALHRESGEAYGKFRAICIETHRIPNGPQLEGAPEVFLKAGEEFFSQTVFHFKY